MGAIFLMPLLYACYTSVVGGQGFTLAYYGEIVSRPLYQRVFTNTIDISVSATICTLVAAYPIAYHLSKRTPRQRALLAILVLLPFWTSILVKSFAFTVILGHEGIINTLLGLVGVGPVPILFNRVSLMIGLTHFLIPFMIFAILPSLLAQPKELRSVAELMGAGSWRIFWRITFPLSMPGVLAGVLVCFALSLGTFVAPALLGGSRDMMIGNLIDFHVHDTLNWSMASALAVTLMILAAFFSILIGRVRGGDPISQR